MKRLIRSAAVALCVASLAAAPAAAGLTDVADDAATLIGVERSRAGTSTLDRIAGLDAIARAQAARMRDAGGIFHNGRLGADLNDRRIAWTRAGENVGAGPTLDRLHAAFMASPQHRQNIEDARFDAVGIGVAQAPDGRLYIAEVFADLAWAQPTPRCGGSVRAEDGGVVPRSFYGC